MAVRSPRRHRNSRCFRYPWPALTGGTKEGTGNLRRTERRAQMNAQHPGTEQAVTASAAASPSSWRPFRHSAFAVVWAATVVSNIGSWMYSAASGWLMTSLAPEPFIVSLVQVATTLPMVLLALPAGALADVVDRRRLLIATELATTTVVALFAAF